MIYDHPTCGRNVHFRSSDRGHSPTVGGKIQLSKVVNWNIATRRKPLEELRQMDADVALLQDVSSGPAGRFPEGLETGSRRHWDSYTWAAGYPENRFRTWCDRWPMIVKLSDRVELEWLNQVGPNGRPAATEISVSDIGLIAAARVIPRDPEDGEPFIAVSMYAHWNQ